MSTTVTLEDVLRERVTSLKELKLATVLLGHRDALKEQLFAAKLEMSTITKGIDVMRNDLERMKAHITYCRNLSLILGQLDEKLVHMDKNLPAKFIQEFTSLNKDASPVVKSSNVRSNVGSDDDTCVTKVCERVTNICIDTPEHPMKECKKTLFKNTEDSWTVDPLNKEEFTKVPKYMIGRQSLNTLNDLVTVINVILEAKYGLLALGKNGARKKGKLDLYLSLKRDEIVVAPGEDPIYFFTAEDYHRHTQSKLDKTKLNLLTVLRHCKRLRESRVGKSLQYIVVPR